MKTAIVIINGIKFPFSLTDHAIAWAKKESAKLNALFLTSGEEMPESYIFPSDIDLAENITDIKDAEEDSLKIMHSQMHLFKNMLKAEGISGFAESMNDASLEQVLDKVKTADLLFIAPDYGESDLVAITDFSMQDLADKAPCAVELVQEND
jgi:hypothetical protein